MHTNISQHITEPAPFNFAPFEMSGTPLIRRTRRVFMEKNERDPAAELFVSFHFHTFFRIELFRSGMQRNRLTLCQV